MINFMRRLFGVSAPFCKRWGHRLVRGFGPGRESCSYTWMCIDAGCGYTETSESSCYRMWK